MEVKEKIQLIFHFVGRWLLKKHQKRKIKAI